MKVIITDLDGTLYKDNLSLEESKKAIDLFREKGNFFIIATGRNLTSLLNVIESFRIKYDYLICNDGSKIYDADLNLVYEKLLDREVVEGVIDILKTSNGILDYHLDDGINYSKDINSKVVAINGPMVDFKTCSLLLKEVLDKVRGIRGYLSRYYINLLNKDVNKATAINVLLEKLNLNKRDVITIGNDVNDIEMLVEFNGYKMSDSVSNLDILDINICEDVKDLIEENTFN